MISSKLTENCPISLYMEWLPKDVLTLLFTYLSTQSRTALLAAFPQLATSVNWNVLYHQKYNPLMEKIRIIHDKYFPITKAERITAMMQYYSETTLKLYDYDYDEDYDKQNIPIINTDQYRIDDYCDHITDYIYNDIRKLKWD